VGGDRASSSAAAAGGEGGDAQRDGGGGGWCLVSRADTHTNTAALWLAVCKGEEGELAF
jgi:hypothetical protein